MKTKIQACFNKSAESYDSAAAVQIEIATKLANQLPSQAQTILEIGCGTGLFTAKIIKCFPEANLLITDLAPNMLEKCKQRFSHLSNITFACIDGEDITTETSYDLIVSNMTLHWFSEHQQSFRKLISQLNPGGSLVFAMLGENSFHEWREIFDIKNYPVATPRFPRAEAIQNVFPAMRLTTDTIIKSHATLLDFLTSLKKIGATASPTNYQPLSPGKLRKIIRDYATEFNISYEVIYGHYVKS